MTSDGPSRRVTPEAVAEVWRREAPVVLAALARRHGDFADCEDAAQEAALAAAAQWPVEGLPDEPRAWLVTVASRRLVDAHRSAVARSRREDHVALAPEAADPAADERPASHDDTLLLLVLCCHPALSEASRVALTLRSVGGLTTEQVAAAFLVPTATVAQRISRAKATLRQHGARFERPAPEQLAERLPAVRQVLYLAFNEGYTATDGERVTDVSLAEEAIRLARVLERAEAAGGRRDDETTGLLALMLLTHARRDARTDARGDLVPLAEQARSQWDTEQLSEGIRLVTGVLARAEVGPYQLQAAIAAVHAEAATYADTDWLQITLLYRLLDRIAPGPAVTLNLAVAVGMAHGPEAGLAVLASLDDDPALARSHRLPAVRGHLRELAGDRPGALADYREAARLTRSRPEQRYLVRRATQLAGATTIGQVHPEPGGR
jgi:RNA polymerase sigma factor (sigma-70 family)